MVVLIALLAFVLCSTPHSHAESAEQPHNCRMWGVVGAGIPDSLIYNHLIAYPYSIEHLSEVNNVDGWGIAYYQSFGDYTIIERGAIRAHEDPNFDMVVNDLEQSRPDIILAHVRRCSSGCCEHGSNSVPDPHPYTRHRLGKDWTFVHNGAVNVSLMYSLIGDEYLQENPPDGSGLPECDPSDTSLVVDSELLFLLLMKHIEAHPDNPTHGIMEAMITIHEASCLEALNFILSDGYSMWSYCYGRSLYYVENDGYRTVASRYPTDEQGEWAIVGDYQLLAFEYNRPARIIDLRGYLPRITGIVSSGSGLPVKAAYVSVDGKPFNSWTNTNGEYILSGLNYDTHSLRCRDSYYADTLIEGVAVDIDNFEIIRNIVMREPAKLSGVVVDQTMAPADSVRVVVLNSSQRAYTDIDGFFMIDSLDTGTFDAAFYHPYYDDTTVTGLTLHPDSMLILNMIMNDPAYIGGVVINDEGNPLINIPVRLTHVYKLDTTGNDGAFGFDSLDTGVYGLRISYPNYADASIDSLIVASGDSISIEMRLRFIGYAYLPGDVTMYYPEWPPRLVGRDVTYLINYLRDSEYNLPCLLDGFWASADANGDCLVDAGDVTRLIMYFRMLADISYCPDYPPRWSTPDELPEYGPSGWPACGE